MHYTHPHKQTNTERLAEALREERRNEGVFQPLPFHYVEIAHLLLQGWVGGWASEPAFLSVNHCMHAFIRLFVRSLARSFVVGALRPVRGCVTDAPLFPHPSHPTQNRATDEFTMPDRTRNLIEVCTNTLPACLTLWLGARRASPAPAYYHRIHPRPPPPKKKHHQDIENVRMEKIRRGVQGMSDTVLRGRSVMSTKVRPSVCPYILLCGGQLSPKAFACLPSSTPIHFFFSTSDQHPTHLNLSI